MLKAPKTKYLKPECEEPLSNFAFNFNLRRYNKDATSEEFTAQERKLRKATVGRCRLTL